MDQGRLDDLAQRGGNHLDQGHPEQALPCFQEGLELARRLADSASISWFSAHVGFTHVELRQWALARHALTQAILYGHLGNPYVHMMRGIALYEDGDLPEAKNELFKAAVLAGPDVFAETDPRYWDFAIKGMALPAGCADWRAWGGTEPGSELHATLCDPSVYQVFRSTDD